MGLNDLVFGFSRLKSFTQLGKGADVKVDTGGGDNITAKHTAPPGDDSQPLPGDRPALTPGSAEGTANVVGYVDDKNPLIALAGEKRIYSRDADGNIVAITWLKNDGTILFMNGASMTTHAPDGTVTTTNGAGTYTLLASGTINLNGVTIDPSGNIITPTTITAATATAGTVVASASLTVAGKEQAGHLHLPGAYNIGGTPVTGNSGAQP